MPDLDSLPVPTDDQKQQYVQDINQLPVPDSSVAGSAASTATPTPGTLPIPTPQQAQTYVSSVADLPTPPPDNQGVQSGTDAELRNRSFFDRPAVRAQEVKPDEISGIASKYGIDPQELQQLAPYFGARMPGREAAEATGYAGEIGLNIPQKLYKMSQSPSMEQALDEVQQLAAGRESYLGLAGQVAAPILPGVGAGASLGKVIAHGAGIGAVAGAAGAPRGQELEGAGFGAAVGGVLGTVGDAISKKLAGAAAPDVEKGAAAQVVRNSAPDIDKGTQSILDGQKASIGEIEDRVLTPWEDSPDLTPDAVDTILIDRVPDDQMQSYLDPETSEGALMAQRAKEEVPDVIEKEGLEAGVRTVAAQDIVDQDQEEFAKWLTGKKIEDPEAANAAIQDYSSRQGGADALQDRWQNFLTERAGNQYVTDNFVRAGREGTFLNKAMNHISDAQFVLRDIDNRTGTTLEPIHNELNTQYNRMSYARQSFQQDLDSIFREAKASGIDQEIVQSPKIYQAIDSGNFSELSPEEAQLAERFKAYFAKGLDYVNGANKAAGEDSTLTPLSIPKRENYVPYQLLPGRELESAIQEKLDQSGLVLENLDPKSFQRALGTSPELNDVVQGMGTVSSMAAPKSGPELLARLNDMFNTQAGRTELDTIAKAAMERGDTPPPLWMRQTNLYKLADGWTGNTLRHLYLRDPIEKMGSQMRILRKAGGELEANYLQNLLSDLQGTRKGTASEYFGTIGDRYNKAIDRMVATSNVPGAQEVGGTLKAIPAMMRDATRNIYANILGLSSHAAILHILHPLVKTLPEIGLTPYGSYSFMRGTVKALSNFSEYSKALEVHGLIPSEMIPKYRQAIEEGIRRSSLYAMPMDAVGKLSETALYVFRKLDMINRMLVHGTADSIISDLGQGSAEAQKVLAKLPTSIQNSIRGAASPEDATHALSVYLNASTSYNYNRPSMSEFGRTMGPFFSTFTKWPTATAGEIIAEYREKGATAGTIRNFEKFVAPLLILKTMDTVIKNYAGDGQGEMTDREKVALGHEGLSGAAPLGSIAAVASGKLFAPPAVDLFLRSVVEPIKAGSPDKMKGALIAGLQEFAPGSVYVRFITDDLVTYLTGERPEGSNFVERTESGARTLNTVSK